MNRDEILLIPGMTEETMLKILPHLKGRSLFDCFKEPHIYELLSKSSIDFLTYKPVGHIPIKNIDALAKKLKKYGAEITGSYRRKVPFVNDIDIIIPRSSDVDAMLKEFPFTNPYSEGKDIIRTLYKVDKTTYTFVDIFKYDPADKAFMLLYTTGSANFNIRMRHVAHVRGFKLNQKSLEKLDGTKIVCETEEEIFKAIGLTYHPPTERNL